MVLRLADELFERLLMLDDEDIEPIAEELAAIEELRCRAGMPMQPLSVAGTGRTRAPGPQLAAQGQALFVWMQRGME